MFIDSLVIEIDRGEMGRNVDPRRTASEWIALQRRARDTADGPCVQAVLFNGIDTRPYPVNLGSSTKAAL